MVPWTSKEGKIRTAEFIRWPDKDVPAYQSLLQAIIVPVPSKLRMSLTRIRALAHSLVQAAAELFPEFAGQLIFNCRYQLAPDYLQRAPHFGVSEDGCFQLLCRTALSRFIGLIEITHDEEPLFDVLLDATETLANPSALALVGHGGMPTKYHTELATIASVFAAQSII